MKWKKKKKKSSQQRQQQQNDMKRGNSRVPLNGM